jgi:metal-responsive CopG/Arc/MetJ family transcriptional regulator
MSDDSRTFDQRLELRVSTAFLKIIDDWRRKQEDLPNRSEAIRRIVEAELKGRRSKSKAD